MARNASPNFHQELQNVQIDPDHDQNSSIETLKSYIEALNPNKIPHFLSHLSNPKNPENFSENEKLSFLDLLIRTQNRKIAPYISPIITLLIQIISNNHNPSFNLHETCSNLISSISRFGIDPLSPQNDKIRVLGSLITPLSDQLMSSQESTRSICAFCIKALVESDNWKFAPHELVDLICSKLAGSIQEEFCRTISHLELVISLSTLDSLIIEPYSRSIIKSGLSILSSTQSGPHMKLISIEMINSLMKSVDSRAISSEIRNILSTLQNFRIESTPIGAEYRSAVSEALNTARSAGAKSEFGFEKCWSPIEGLVAKSSPKSLLEFDTVSEPPSTKEKFFNGSGFKRVSGFGSRLRNSLDGETGRCSIHEKCNRCTNTSPNSPVWNSSQGIRRNNSMDNLRIVSSSPNKGSRNICFNLEQVDSKFLKFEGKPKQDLSSESKERKMMNGGSNQDCLSCEVCHKASKKGIVSKKNFGRCNIFVFSLILGILVVFFAVVFRVWLVDLDEEVYWVPT